MGMFTALAVYASLRTADDRRWWAAWTVCVGDGDRGRLGNEGTGGPFSGRDSGNRLVDHAPHRFLARGRSATCSRGLRLALLAALVWMHQPARDILSAYCDKQVLISLQGARETTESHLGAILSGLVPLPRLDWDQRLAAGWWRGGVQAPGVGGWGLGVGSGEASGPLAFCLLTALRASLPIMISPKQSAYYAAASWPFLCMALAIWCLPAVAALGQRLDCSRQICAIIALAANPRASAGRTLSDGRAVAAVVRTDFATTPAHPRRRASRRSSDRTHTIVIGPAIERNGRCRPICTAGISSRSSRPAPRATIGWNWPSARKLPAPGYSLEDAGLTCFGCTAAQEVATTPEPAAPLR